MLDQLKDLLAGSSLSLGESQYAQLLSYHELLLDWNTRMDLTNVPPQEMALRHYADSLLALEEPAWFPQGCVLIDVGTGAGFPALPLLIARPDLKVCLLDASRKRIDFLSAVRDALGLKGLMIIHGRAEDAARGALREACDLAVARALAPVNVLCELLLPFVRCGGHALCWKGPSIDEEMAAAQQGIRLLGGKAGKRLMLPLPGFTHCVQSIDKTGVTDKQYPRQAGTPARKPL
ncbi:MAG: 16S rRNA (guanine(527)-N(7))-methyltransferase RsmG [Christensenellales bacterium]